MGRRTRKNRPKMLNKPVAVYRGENDWYPGQVRILFEDGTTQIYDLRQDQPHPALVHSIRIIEQWRTGYQAPEGHRMHEKSRPR